MPTHQPLLNALELARHLGIGRATVYNLLNAGMPSIKIGSCRRFRIADVEAWLIERTNADDAA